MRRRDETRAKQDKNYLSRQPFFKEYVGENNKPDSRHKKQ